MEPISLPIDIINDCISFLPLKEILKLRIVCREIRNGIDARTRRLDTLNIANLHSYAHFLKNKRWLEQILFFVGRQCSRTESGSASVCEVKGFVGDAPGKPNKNALGPESKLTMTKIRNICFENVNIKRLVLPQIPVDDKKALAHGFVFLMLTNLKNLEDITFLGHATFGVFYQGLLEELANKRNLVCPHVKRIQILWGKCDLHKDLLAKIFPNLERVVFVGCTGPFLGMEIQQMEIVNDILLLKPDTPETLKLSNEKLPRWRRYADWSASVDQYYDAIGGANWKEKVKFMRYDPSWPPMGAVRFHISLVALCMNVFDIDPTQHFSFCKSGFVNWDAKTAAEGSQPSTMLELMALDRYEQVPVTFVGCPKEERIRFTRCLPEDMSTVFYAPFWKQAFERCLEHGSPHVRKAAEACRFKLGESTQPLRMLNANTLRETLSMFQITNSTERTILKIAKQLIELGQDITLPGFVDAFTKFPQAKEFLQQEVAKQQQREVTTKTTQPASEVGKKRSRETEEEEEAEGSAAESGAPEPSAKHTKTQ